MNILDIRTVIFSQVVTDLTCVSVLVFLYYQSRKRILGIGFWVADLSFQTLGILPIFLRSLIPDWPSIGFTNLTVVGGTYLGLLGLERFSGRKSSQRFNALFVIVFALINEYFTFLQPNLNIRNVLLSIGLLVMCIQCIWLIFHRMETDMQRMMSPAGFVFGLICIYSLLRFVVALVIPAAPNVMFQTDIFNIAILLVNQVLLILLSFSLMLLVNRYLSSETNKQGDAFTKIFKESVVALSLADFEMETFIDVNDEWLKMTGFRRDEVIGKNESMVMVWKDPLDWDKLKHNLKEHSEVYPLEVQRRRKNGDEYTALMTAQTLNLWGKQTLLISSLDITERKQMQEQLTNALEYERNFLEKSPIGIITYKASGETVSYNPAIVQIIGGTEEKIRAQNFRNLESWKNSGMLSAAEEALASGTDKSVDAQVLTTFGKEIWMSCRFVPFSHGDGQFLLAMFSDITAKMRAEEEVRQSQENFARAFNSNPAALAITRLADGKFISVNEAYTRVMGYVPSQILGQTVAELNIYVNPDERDRLIQRLHEHGSVRNYEVLVRNKSGDLRNLLLSMEPTLYYHEECILSTFLDITERKEAEQEILTLNDRLQVLITAVQELAAARDLEAVMAAVRSSARKLTGSDGSTFVLREDDQCYYADEDAISPLWKGQRFPMSACISGWVMLNKRPAVIEDIYADPRVPIDVYRATFVKSLVMVPIRTNDPLGAIGNYWAKQHQPTEIELQLVQTLADAAARAVENVRLLEELEQRVRDRTVQLETANHELEAFSYSVSHDLRAPLRAMSGFSRILTEEYQAQVPSEAVRYLGLIEQNAAQMGELIDDLLRFSRLSRQPLNKQMVVMDEMVHQVLEELSAEREGRQVKIKIGKLPECQADPALLKQVWVNLLSNAIKFTRKREVAKIEIGYLPHPPLPSALAGTSPDEKWEGDGGGAYFVKDNGVGFDMQYVQKLFGVFQRLHRAEDYEGTGVGLAIVQRVVHRHGGHVWAEAKVDKGATFYFTLGGGTDE